ncbi:MAG: CHASE2 domain-containing protein [Limnothrix sp. RL_2_0]|nr:CHASE2 domain-containing protein [Limnothrix sp. RL_2_0]
MKIRIPPKLKFLNFSTAYQNFANATLSSFVAVGLSFTGIFQLVEWAYYDQILSFRPIEPPDPNLVIITFDEADLEEIGAWPIPDDALAEILSRITQYGPRVIGLDLYRNLPVGRDGHEALIQIFESNENLYGVTLQGGKNSVGASSVLEEFNRIALADVILDVDSKVRRSLLSTRNEAGALQLSIGTQLALTFLSARGIEPEVLENQDIRLGEAIVSPLRQNEGGYVNADMGGFQTLLNYRGLEDNFHTISITDVLADRIPGELIQNRIVLIGATAGTLNDFFQTPYNGNLFTEQIAPVPGVIIHANITSQLVSAALGDRALLKTIPDYWEWAWAFGWAILGTSVINFWLEHLGRVRGELRSRVTIMLIFIILEAGLLVAAGLALLLNWWIPIMPASFALGLSGLFCILWSNRQLHNLATLDELTQVANRRSLDHYLTQIFTESTTPVCLILCDIDHFKLYNDTYGHQCGDVCLYQVAKSMRDTICQQDFVSRYGGEEFAIILKKTTPELAEEIAWRLCKKVYELNIPHIASETSESITMSCGVSVRALDRPMTKEELIMMADQALYFSKKRGRNRVTVYKKANNQLPESF